MVLPHFLLVNSENSSSSLEKQRILLSSLTKASSTTASPMSNGTSLLRTYVGDSFPNKCHLFPDYRGLIAMAYMTFVSALFHLFKAVFTDLVLAVA